MTGYLSWDLLKARPVPPRPPQGDPSFAPLCPIPSAAIPQVRGPSADIRGHLRTSAGAGTETVRAHLGDCARTLRRLCAHALDVVSRPIVAGLAALGAIVRQLAARDARQLAASTVAASTSWREAPLGESRAVEWPDVDLERGIVLVHRTEDDEGNVTPTKGKRAALRGGLPTAPGCPTFARRIAGALRCKRPCLCDR
jgi:hypothetical protein